MSLFDAQETQERLGYGTKDRSEEGQKASSMLAVFQWTEHFSTLISRGSGEPDKPIDLRFGPVGCRYAQPTIHSINGDAVKKRVKARRRGFEHIFSFMLGSPREGLEVVLMFLERGFCLWHYISSRLLPVQYNMTLIDELYCTMVEVGYGARRSKIPGPLAHTLIDTAQKSLDLWRRDQGAALRFAAMVLSGPTDLRKSTGQLPEPVRSACWRLLGLLEYMASLSARQ